VIPKNWTLRPARLESVDISGLREMVKRERLRQDRQDRERHAAYYDALLAEAEYDAWRATRDW
jgi:hypothetical protein